MRPRFLAPRLFLGLIAVSFGAILIRFASDAPALAVAGWRLGLAALVLVPVALVRGFGHRSMTRGEWVGCAASGCALALHFILWILSLRETSVARSVLFMSTHPFFVAAGSTLFLGERLPRRWAIGGALAVIGGAVIGGADLLAGKAALRGDLLALGAGASAGIYFVIGRHLRKTVSALPYAAVTYAAAAGVVLAAAVLTRTPLTGFSGATYGYLLLLGTVPQLIGHTTFNWALAHLPASRVSILILGEPVGAALLALLLFGETITWLNVAGGAIILVGIYLSLQSEEDPHGHDHRPSQD